MRAIVSGAFERAVGLLSERRALLEEGATRLLERETLNEEELQGLRGRLPQMA